ncbi:PREDICTED: uncharacterized protein LOC108378950, partial [Rhagoletis zephyria]|uniref:uncharacterized protein LOC108378950 n=1 Tax=Rhagoletis zephyria TaxID=28612 RepID=UPI00081133E9
KWPTLVIRYSNRIVLQYNGEWTLEAVQRFIDFIFIPVERLNSRLELKRLTMQRDAVVLGVFGNGSQLEFRKFVSAGIKWLETDPVSSFRFAAAIGPAAKDILHRANDTQQRLPQLLLITSKGVVEMPPSEWNVSNIVVWLQTEFARSLNVLYGYNSPKSLTMLLHLSPVLTVIANDYFYEYMNTLTNYGISLDEQCHTDIWQSEMAKLQELGYVQHTMEKSELLKPLTCSAKEYLSQWNLRYYYALDSYLKQFICGLRRNCTFEKGLASSNNIHKLCTSKHRNSSPSRKIAAAKYLKKFVDDNWNQFKSGHNQTLSVVIVDHGKHLDFLKSQGIPHVDNKNFVTLMIADRLKESIFLFQDEFTYESLQQFVQSYYSKVLVAYKTGSSLKTIPSLPQRKLFLENVNNEMFIRKVDQHNFTTIALLYSPQCMFSALAIQALIQLSTMLDDLSGIQIIRINTLINDLPWEFKIYNSPTLIVFPRGRALDSQVFPSRLKFNVRNVFSFALAQMETVDQLKALISYCRRRRWHSLRMRNCIQFVKRLAAQHKMINMEQQITEDYIVPKQMMEWNHLKSELKSIFPLY